MKKFRQPEQQIKSTLKSVKGILAAWDNDVSTEMIIKQKQLISRRLFLGQSAALVGAVAVSAGVSAKSKNHSAPPALLTQPWLSISEVQQHLFPRTDESVNPQKSSHFSPGAKDFNAIGYLYTMLHTADADVDERKFIIKGITWLDGMANTMAGASFLKLNYQDRERVLKTISASDTGETWLSTLLRYIFEALLTDPVYGGNTNSIGWQWLEHQPGFPRPPENKKYWLLSKNNSDQKSVIKPATLESGPSK